MKNISVKGICENLKSRLFDLLQYFVMLIRFSTNRLIFARISPTQANTSTLHDWAVARTAIELPDHESRLTNV